MALNSNGFTNSSVDKFLIDAGAVYLNTTFTDGVLDGTLLGATSGGNEFVVQQEIRQIQVDGMKGRGKGLQVISFMNPNLTVNLKEMTAENLAKAIAGGDVDTADTNYDIITSKGTIETTDYIDNIALVGRLTGSDKPVVVVIYNVLSIEGLEMTTEDNNEVVIPITFGGHYDETMEVPYKIYYPKA